MMRDIGHLSGVAQMPISIKQLGVYEQFWTRALDAQRREGTTRHEMAEMEKIVRMLRAAQRMSPGRLRECLKALGWSFQYFSERIGCPPEQVRSWLNSKGISQGVPPDISRWLESQIRL